MKKSKKSVEPEDLTDRESTAREIRKETFKDRKEKDTKEKSKKTIHGFRKAVQKEKSILHKKR